MPVWGAMDPSYQSQRSRSREATALFQWIEGPYPPRKGKDQQAARRIRRPLYAICWVYSIQWRTSSSPFSRTSRTTKARKASMKIPQKASSSKRDPKALWAKLQITTMSKAQDMAAQSSQKSVEISTSPKLTSWTFHDIQIPQSFHSIRSQKLPKSQGRQETSNNYHPGAKKILFRWILTEPIKGPRKRFQPCPLPQFSRLGPKNLGNLGNRVNKYNHKGPELLMSMIPR